ncbi:MAG: GUN4 domain-containing protein, partial [Leptolyngbyaceae bacterium]|nr:GUN4 domain-containing protein [Leptolyngbyaceae bacterium]
ALKHGYVGLNLVIQAFLNDQSELVRKQAYLILRERTEPRVRHVLALFSKLGINYTHLRNLLVSKRWREADQETKALLFQVSTLQQGGEEGTPERKRLTDAQIANLPCEDLQIMDRLWVKYSRGRFGFSIQQRIWQKCYQTFWDKGEMWQVFANRVGWRESFLQSYHWRRYDELIFNLKAPEGHLPHLGDQFGIHTVEAFSKVLTECQHTHSN